MIFPAIKHSDYFLYVMLALIGYSLFVLSNLPVIMCYISAHSHGEDHYGLEKYHLYHIKSFNPISFKSQHVNSIKHTHTNTHTHTLFLPKNTSLKFFPSLSKQCDDQGTRRV